MAILIQERAIDRQFAAFICRESGGTSNDLFRLLVSLASRAVGEGNSCLALAECAGQMLSLDGKEIAVPVVDALEALLRTMPTVGWPGQQRPLVLDVCNRLYLYRYWRYEQELARNILHKASSLNEGIDEAILQDGLERLFPGCEGEKSDRQKEAASMALHKQFSVISGGPGTGKTSTVVRILALLLEQNDGRRQKIAMTTPTGKAAARLKASVNDMRPTLACSEEIKAAIPDSVVTIQRLLGALSGSSRFRHSSKNPLPFDTVIVDEASMIALPLMTALVGALKPSARLILLGDKDQLASVEAGAVLGDICSAGEEGSEASLLSGSLIKLEKNYRFQGESGIGEISRAVNAGFDRDALALLKGERLNGIAWQDLPSREELRGLLKEKVLEGYQRYLAAESPSVALERFGGFRVLCALRDGPYGVSGLNSTVETILARGCLIDPQSSVYRGRPILVTVNDYAMRLFNGDTGLLFPDPDRGGALMAFFPAPDGGMRSIMPERLPQHETAFAMTIHKSQGSEFKRVVMVLPPADSDVLTRELIYTGITRAKESVEIWAGEDVFCRAVRKKTARHSGLREALFISNSRS